MNWHRFGRRCSEHDIDLVLVGEDVLSISEAFDELTAILLPDPHVSGDTPAATVSVRLLSAILPAQLLAEAIALGRREGLPLDLFLSTWPDAFSVGAWLEPPFDVAEVAYRFTDRFFFIRERE